MALAEAYSGKQQPQAAGPKGGPPSAKPRAPSPQGGRMALAQMAQARQKFTNREYAQAQRDMRNARKEAAKQQEMQTRTAWGMAGMGAQIGAAGGPAAMGIGAAAGLGLGILGEMGTRTGQGENFFEALGNTVGRLPTATEVQQIGTGIMGGVLSNRAATGGKGNLLGMASASQRPAAAVQAGSAKVADPMWFGAAKDTPEMKQTLPALQTGLAGSYTG